MKTSRPVVLVWSSCIVATILLWQQVLRGGLSVHLSHELVIFIFAVLLDGSVGREFFRCPTSSICSIDIMLHCRKTQLHGPSFCVANDQEILFLLEMSNNERHDELRHESGELAVTV